MWSRNGQTTPVRLLGDLTPCRSNRAQAKRIIGGLSFESQATLS
jgi:hypothetical protein